MVSEIDTKLRPEAVAAKAKFGGGYSGHLKPDFCFWGKAGVYRRAAKRGFLTQFGSPALPRT